MEIKVLGTGCSSCKALYANVVQAVNELGVTANVVKEEDMMKIMNYNVMQLPALVIDEKVVASGQKLSKEELITLLTKNDRIQQTPAEIKKMVQERYNELATHEKQSCCCSKTPMDPSQKTYTIMSENYSHLVGYVADADLGVGCGLPTEYARIQKGDTVLDLGSGAGNDCFVARAETGETGKIIGIDFAPNMVERARKNAEKMQYSNMVFLLGDIEDMPIADNSIDVVISNCVLNLLPDKSKIFREIYRVLKPDGHFCVSDIVLEGYFPKAFTESAAMYAGCISSAIQKTDYLAEIIKAGFADIKVERTKSVLIPDDVLQQHLDNDTIEEYRNGKVGIYSITVTGNKSALNN